MRYILPHNILLNIDFLKENYQKNKPVDLNNKPGFFSWPIILGGVDVQTRKKQIEFLEKIYFILKPNILKEEDIQTSEQLFASITAARILIAATLFVKHRIAEQCYISSESKSVLYQLLDQNLAITATNYLDEEDKEVCILAAKRYVTSSISALDQANSALHQAQKKIFKETEWNEFLEFVCQQPIRKVSPDLYVNYPITNITQKLFGAAGAYTGASIGLLMGDMISQSNAALSGKTRLTLLIGGTLLVFNSAGPAGIALLAPAIAERLLNAFLKISLAQILGMSMGVVGQGVGIAVGMPLDLSYQMLIQTCKMVINHAFTQQNLPLSGIRISDGASILAGMSLEEIQEGQLNEGNKEILVEIKDSELYMDGQLIPKLSEEQTEALRQLIPTSLTQSTELNEEHIAPCPI